MSAVTRASNDIPSRICESDSFFAGPGRGVAKMASPQPGPGPLVMDGGKARRFPKVDSTLQMTSHPHYGIFIPIPFPKESTYLKSPIANILHTYTGKIMLSFCPDMASSTDPSPIIDPYRTTLLKISPRDQPVLPPNKYIPNLPKSPPLTHTLAAPTQTPPPKA